MMRPPAHITQVRGANFRAEIPDGISSRAIVRYRTVVRDDVEYSGYSLMLVNGSCPGRVRFLRELPDR